MERLHLSAAARRSLEAWLGHFHPGFAEAAGRIRDFLFVRRQARGSDLAYLGAAISEVRAAYGLTWRAADHWTAPIGRMARPSGAPCLSDWERCWLIVQDLAEQGALDRWSDRLREVSLVHARPVELVAIVAVCGEPDSAEHLARDVLARHAGLQSSQAETTWLEWLAGHAVPASTLARDAFPPPGVPLPAVEAALQADWPAVVEALPSSQRRPSPEPVASGAGLLAQLAGYNLEGSPELDVIETSFARFFGSSSHPHASFDLPVKLSFAVVWGREIAPARPTELLASMADYVPHLRIPPRRVFQIPVGVVDALAALAKLVGQARAERKTLVSWPSEAGVAVELSSLAPPVAAHEAVDETSLAGVVSSESVVSSHDR